MKKYILFILLLIPVQLFAQFTPVEIFGPSHQKYLDITVQLEDGQNDSVIVQFPPLKKGGGLFTRPTKYQGAYVDTLANDALPFANWQTRIPVWAGYCEVDILPTNTDIDDTDSLYCQVYALDYDGYVISNDYVYAKFNTTPPGYTTSTYYNSWTTATRYRTSLSSNTFGFGTYGLLFIFRPGNDGGDDTYMSLRIRVYLY